MRDRSSAEIEVAVEVGFQREVELRVAQVGDVVDVQTPGGLKSYEIVDVQYI